MNHNSFTEAKSEIEPSRANPIKRLSGPPVVDRVSKPLDETLEQIARAYRLSARPRQTRCCIFKTLWGMRAVHADSHDASRPSRSKTKAFNENPSTFRATKHQIIWPFETDIGRAEIRRGARQRHSRNEAELRRDRWRTGIDHQGASVKVALRRNPRPSASPSPRGLFFCDDPQAIDIAR